MSTTSATPAALAHALDRMWAKFSPEMLERLSILESAAASFSAGRIAPAQLAAAASAAHKLAGVLGTFGLAQGTVLARQLEQLYSAAGGPARSDAARLAALAAELRSVIQSRK